jgi:hypothetical protein
VVDNAQEAGEVDRQTGDGRMHAWRGAVGHLVILEAQWIPGLESCPLKDLTSHVTLRKFLSGT